MRTSLPARGLDDTAIRAELEARKAGDVDWRDGRAPLYIFKATDAAFTIGRDGFNAYFSENALGARRAFPSVKGMEEEVLAMALDLFHGPAGAQGFMTTGGTESIVLAVQTCRNHARKQRRDPHHRGNLVLPETAHPAFDKAAQLMDLVVRRVPVAADLRANPTAMAAAIDADTIMLVGSAPCFPYGCIDPIAAIAALAAARGIWCHVDACVGGYLAPFVKAIGHHIPDFDLAVPGVSSLSADLHKYGFCPKPASTLFYRSADIAAHHGFDADVWPNGRFTTGTIVGTRPAGGVAGAWATMMHLGRAGYEAVARDLMAGIARYRQGVAAIDGLRVLGAPELAIVAVASDTVDVFRVAEVMQTRGGWLPGLVQRPQAIHRMMSMLHVASMDAYLADLAAAVAIVRAEGGAQVAAVKAVY